MIKQIGKHNILVSPFSAVKAWELDNVQNQDVVLLEELSASVQISDTEVALDYVDYTTSPLSVNSDCDIALEQQDADKANYEEGVSGSGLFNIESEERNSDGTYKRLVYDQTYRAFYNQYRNPTQIFGLDNIDFSLSKINRFLGNEFLLFNIPRTIMGDKLVAGTIKMYDTTMDDNIEIHDDSYGNLIVGRNLFSKIQEVRPLSNSIVQGSSSFSCPALNNPPLGIPDIDAIQTWLPDAMPTITASQVVSEAGCIFDDSVTGSYYAIDGYYDGMISASNAHTPNEFQQIWDGTFKFYAVDHGTDTYHMFGFAPNTNSYDTQSVINGYAMCNEFMYFTCSNDVPTWTIGIIASSGDLMFGAVKTGSTSPAGVYTNDLGVAAEALGPAAYRTIYAVSTPTTITLTATATPQNSIADQNTCQPT